MPQSRKRKTAKRTYPKGINPASKPATQPKGLSKRTKLIVEVLIAALVVSGVIYFFAVRKKSDGAEVTTASGLKYVDLVPGTGDSPQAGQSVVVQYKGELSNGKVFEGPERHGGPQTFVIGKGSVIKGWDEGIMSMKVGGKRKLIIPPKLGYGATGKQPDIPPNSTLIFEVELIGIK